jgi:hypothetical protein
MWTGNTFSLYSCCSAQGPLRTYLHIHIPITTFLCYQWQGNMGPIHSTFHSFCKWISWKFTTMNSKIENVNYKWTLRELGSVLWSKWSTWHVHMYIVHVWILIFHLLTIYLLIWKKYNTNFDFHLLRIIFKKMIFKKKIKKDKENSYFQFLVLLAAPYSDHHGHCSKL